MKTIEIKEKEKKIKDYIRKAEHQKAFDVLADFCQLIGDEDLDRKVLLLNAQFSSEFQDYLNGLKSSKDEMNRIVLSLSYTLNDAIKLAEEKFKAPANKESNKDFIEKISLESTDFYKAIKGLSLDEEDKNNLFNAVSIMSDEISKNQDKRVLWIDDNPHDIIAERRLLRSLGLDIVTANNRTSVLQLLEQDGDFDMIISDIQWRKEDGRASYGGLNMIKELREIYKDSFIGKLNVIFYTGYRKEQIEIIDEQTAFKKIKNTSIIFSIDKLIIELFSILNEATNFLTLKGNKKRT